MSTILWKWVKYAFWIWENEIHERSIRTLPISNGPLHPMHNNTYIVWIVCLECGAIRIFDENSVKKLECLIPWHQRWHHKLSFALVFGYAVIKAPIHRLIHVLLDQRQQTICLLSLECRFIRAALVSTQWFGKPFERPNFVFTVRITMICSYLAGAQSFPLVDIRGQRVDRVCDRIPSQMHIRIDTHKFLISRYREQRIGAVVCYNKFFS